MGQTTREKVTRKYFKLYMQISYRYVCGHAFTCIRGSKNTVSKGYKCNDKMEEI